MSAIPNKQARTFTFKAPFAHEVLLAGDFTRWLVNPIALEKQQDGNWRLTTFLAPGTYHYKFYVDNQWRNDPNCKLQVRNAFGTMNNVIQVFQKGSQITTTGNSEAGMPENRKWFGY